MTVVEEAAVRVTDGMQNIAGVDIAATACLVGCSFPVYSQQHQGDAAAIADRPTTIMKMALNKTTILGLVICASATSGCSDGEIANRIGIDSPRSGSRAAGSNFYWAYDSQGEMRGFEFELPVDDADCSLTVVTTLLPPATQSREPTFLFQRILAAGEIGIISTIIYTERDTVAVFAGGVVDSREVPVGATGTDRSGTATVITSSADLGAVSNIRISIAAEYMRSVETEDGERFPAAGVALECSGAATVAAARTSTRVRWFDPEHAEGSGAFLAGPTNASFNFGIDWQASSASGDASFYFGGHGPGQYVNLLLTTPAEQIPITGPVSLSLSDGLGPYSITGDWSSGDEISWSLWGILFPNDEALDTAIGRISDAPNWGIQ